MAKLELQVKVDDIIKVSINPLLKELGFKKSSRNFYKEVGNFGLCFNIQSSIYNDENEVRFTFNTGIVFPDIYELFYDLKLSKFPKEYDCIQRRRIGSLMNTSDYWYIIKKDTNLTNVHEEVKLHMEEYVIPYFLKFNCNENIFDLILIKNLPKAPNEDAFFAGFCILFGDKKYGEGLLRDHYLKHDNEDYLKRLERFAKKLETKIP